MAGVIASSRDICPAVSCSAPAALDTWQIIARRRDATRASPVLPHARPGGSTSEACRHPLVAERRCRQTRHVGRPARGTTASTHPAPLVLLGLRARRQLVSIRFVNNPGLIRDQSSAAASRVRNMT